MPLTGTDAAMANLGGMAVGILYVSRDVIAVVHSISAMCSVVQMYLGEVH
jgi:hypothetical protein